MKKFGKQMLSVTLSIVIVLTALCTGAFNASGMAGNAPVKTYTFDEIKAMSDIPVMNVTMKDSGEYDLLKTVKDKRDMLTFDLFNPNNAEDNLHLETKIKDGKATYPLTLKGRGNSSWQAYTGKKPYNIKFDKKQNLLGMGECKSWSLLANWADTSFIRNYMAYRLSSAMGMGTPDCEPVALCIDGKFEGLYLLTEKVGLNEFRTETAGDGYDVNGDGVVTDSMIEADVRGYEHNEPGVFTTDGDVFFVPKDPEAPDLMQSEYDEIIRETNIMEQAVMTGEDYENHIDVDSWVDAYIINELAKNPDFGFGYQNCYASTYLYFQEGGKVYAGPVWDFDLGYGRTSYGNMPSESYRDTGSPTGFLNSATKYYKELFENTDFQEHVMRRWQEIRRTIIPEWLSDTFAQGSAEARRLSKLDFEIWGNYKERVLGFGIGRDAADFEEELKYVKSFIEKRVDWLDGQWGGDEIDKKYSNGKWSRWDVPDEGGYTSYETLKAASEAGTKKSGLDEIWDGGNGGVEKQGTVENVTGSIQTSIPGVQLDSPIKITINPPMGANSWDAESTKIYDWWKDGEIKREITQNNGSLSISIKESGRYVGVTSRSWYLGEQNNPLTMSFENQVYIIDVGTNGSVTLHDGRTTLSQQKTTSETLSTKYGYIEAKNGEYVLSFRRNQDGNAGITVGGSGNKEFGIYVPVDGEEATEITLNITKRHPDSIYSNIPAICDVAYVYARGERPASWSVSGNAVSFDEKTGKITAENAGTATVTAKTSDGMTSSVKVTCTANVADSVEYAVDPTLGKYFGTDGTLTATAEERGTWATKSGNTLTRFSYDFSITENEAKNAKSFTWKTARGNEILGGAADYYVFLNGKPIFAATADALDYAISDFNSSNTAIIKADRTDYNGVYAYMKGRSASTAGMLDCAAGRLKAGTNTLDIFVSGNDGSAFAKPYFTGKNILDDVHSEAPTAPENPEEPDDGADEKLDFYAASLNLQSNLQINFKVKKEDVEAGGYLKESLTAEFDRNGKITNVAATEVDDYFVFTFKNIAPHLIGDSIKATLCACKADDDTVYRGNTVDYSVTKYCYRMLKKEDTSDTLKALLVDLLNYGAAAQVYKQSSVTELVNANLSEAERNLVNTIPELAKTVQYGDELDAPAVKWKAASLVLDDSINMRVVIDNGKLDIKNLVAKVNGTTEIKDFTLRTDENGGYYFDFNDINATQLRNTFAFAVYDKEGNRVGNTLYYGVEVYANAKHNETNDDGSKTNLANLVIAMMRYGDSARAYAGK